MRSRRSGAKWRSEAPDAAKAKLLETSTKESNFVSFVCYHADAVERAARPDCMLAGGRTGGGSCGRIKISWSATSKHSEPQQRSLSSGQAGWA